MATALLFVTVKVIVEVLLALITAGVNALLIRGKLKVVKVALTPLALTAPDAGKPEIRAALLR